MINRGHRYSPAQSYVIPNVCVHNDMHGKYDITYLIFIKGDNTQHVAAFILIHFEAPYCKAMGQKAKLDRRGKRARTHVKAAPKPTR